MCCKIENSNLLCSQQYMKKLVFGFRRSVFNVENEFWFSTSFSLPIGRRTLCRKAKTLFGFWFSTSRLDRPKEWPNTENILLFLGLREKSKFESRIAAFADTLLTAPRVHCTQSGRRSV